MTDEERLLSETGIIAYDLAPSSALPPAPIWAPLRNFLTQPRPPHPRYTPPPLANGYARVKLDCDYDTGPWWNDWAGEDMAYPATVFDIPAEQRDRWQQARDAYAAMQEEISELRAARLATSGFAPPGWVRKDAPYQAQP